MRTRALGDSGLIVSAMCLGCMDFGTRLSEEISYGILDAYFEAGGRFLDTSNNYAFWHGNGGESETVLGNWMRDRGNRNQLIVATKVGAQPTVPGTGLETAEGLSAPAIASAVEASLGRLRTNVIDVYYAHVEDSATPLDETLAAFDQLRSDGKVRSIGCSNHSLGRFVRSQSICSENGWAPYVCLQQRYSLLRPISGADLGVQRAIDEEFAEYLRRHPDLALLSYATLLSGAYEGAELPLNYDDNDNRMRVKQIKQIALDVDVTPNQLILAWSMHSNPSAIPLVASSTPARLKSLLHALEIDSATAGYALSKSPGSF